MHCYPLLAFGVAAEGGVRVILIPSVCRTRSALPISQVSLPLFQVDDEAQPRSRGQSEILLRDAQAFAGGPDQLSDLRGRVFQGDLHGMLPYGNIL